MKYEKAQNILPHGIIELIQKYTDGGYIYIPRKNENKKSWGENTETKRYLKERDKEIADVITGRSDKFLAIIGPCSADNEDAVLDYTLRLKKVQEKIADKVLIIPRVYTNKPRKHYLKNSFLN